MKVDFSGGELTDKEKKIITGMLNANKKASPLMREVRFNIKDYSKGGLRHKIVIFAEAETDFGKIHADSSSWRFYLAVKNICKKLHKQVLHSTKSKKESVHKRFLKRIKQIRR